MTIPNINVYPGRNPAILANPQAVSGFEHWGSVELDGLLECVRDECARVFAAAPQEISDAFGGTIDLPVYGQSGTTDIAAMRFGKTSEMGIQIDRARNQGTLLGFEPQTCDGLMLQAKTGQVLQDLRSKIGHECLHLVSMYAIHSYQIAPWEAVVMRLEKDLYGPRKE